MVTASGGTCGLSGAVYGSSMQVEYRGGKTEGEKCVAYVSLYLWGCDAADMPIALRGKECEPWSDGIVLAWGSER
jgi:hypothetical protein